MFHKIDKNIGRVARHKRVRKNLSGTPGKPRFNVYRSTNNIYVQVIDDVNRVTLVSASTLDKAIKEQLDSTGNKKAARLVGKVAAERAIEKGIKEVVFDRGGYIYHGRVQEVAEGAREAGLQF